MKKTIFRFLIILSIMYSQISATFDTQRYGIDFNTSMKFPKGGKAYKKSLKKKEHPTTQFCKELYEKNNLAQRTPSEQTIIPKIAHVVWIGPKSPPAIFDECITAIKKHLPKWELKIWTNTEVAELKLINKKYFDEEINWGAKADILRYELLYQFGGVYIDIDMIIQQPMDILTHSYEFFAGLHPVESPDIMGEAIFGSIPGHPIIKHTINTIKDHRDEKLIIKRTGPIHFEKAFYESAQRISQDNIIVFPASYFFPIGHKEKKLSPERIAQYIKPETFGIHYWAGTWFVSKKKQSLR